MWRHPNHPPSPQSRLTMLTQQWLACVASSAHHALSLTAQVWSREQHCWSQAVIISPWESCRCLFMQSKSLPAVKDTIFVYMPILVHCILTLHGCWAVSAETSDPPALGQEEGAAPMDSSPAASDSSSDLQSSKQDDSQSSMPANNNTSGSLDKSHHVSTEFAGFSDEQEEAYAAMWQHLFGSNDQAQAAGLPRAPISIQHSTLREDFQSMRIVCLD